MATSSFSEVKRDNILNDLLDSMIDGTEVTSDRIARRRRVSPGSVAAVRANLTRGAYGTRTSLLRRRRSERRSSSSN